MADWRKIRASVWRSWLDGLPDEVYDKKDSAHIVRLLDVLCGDNGVGYLRKRLILKRLQTSLYETRYSDLDTLYSRMFGLPRLESEQYSYTEDALLIWAQISEMDIKDAHYRKRIWDYMRSFQFGGTTTGIALAAQAAVGLRCDAIDGMLYYNSLGMLSDGVSYMPINYDHGEYDDGHSVSDHKNVTVVVDTDEMELTTEQMHSLSSVTARIKPNDVDLTFLTRPKLMSMLGFEDIDDEYVEPISVEASSHWWNVVRTVTGRPDWVGGSVGSEWVEANVAKEAPQQVLSNRQESEYDFTSMVNSCSASSEHIGRYNAAQRRIFASLNEAGADFQKPASNSLSQASSKLVTIGYYGTASVIDGAYPLSYKSEAMPFFMEEGRSHRFWSSDERGGSEWVEIGLKRLVPLNSVRFSIFKKPLRIRLYYSSYAEDDARVWVPARDRYGRALSFTFPEWCSGDGSEMVDVSFDSVAVKADAVRIEFERLDIPYRSALDDAGTYESEDFPWSVECSDISLRYSIKDESDFISTTYEDMFGNRVDTSLRTMGADNIIDGDDGTYWMSQPNVGESAVEYVIVKVSDSPVRINFIDIDAVYAGCQMNLYSTDGGEPGDWVPYPQVYQLQSGRYALPIRKVTYIKLEFTTLCATPYDASVPNVLVRTRRFPWDVRDYCDSRFGESYEESLAQQLLEAPTPLYDDGSVQSILGIEELYDYNGMDVDYHFYGNASLSTMQSPDMFKSFQDNIMYAVYGDDMAREGVNVPKPDAASLGGQSSKYRFNAIGDHEYDESVYARSANLAYVVGIKDIRLGFSCRVLSINPDETLYMYMQDGRFIADMDGWGFVNGERLGVQSDSLNRFETVNVQSVFPFRTFEFASNQKPPVEKFDYPSDMSREWHGLDSDVESVEFGVSGTVLRMRGDVGSGIESEAKLTRSMAIATAQVDVYPLIGGEWQFDCYDLFGESVFSMRYTLEPTRWTTVGVNFVPMPGGSWWDDDYSYRVRLPISGPVASGQQAFTPVVDTDALIANDMLDVGLNKLRLVFFNGVDVREIPVDMTDNMELWFRVQQDLPSGASADGAYDFDRGVLNGSYYLYFGGPPDSQHTLPAADQPMRDFRDVFRSKMYALSDSTVESDGTVFDADYGMAEFDNMFFLPDEGFMSFEITLDDALRRVPQSDVGVADVRFILDYIDDDKAIQLYFYERQLTFVIRDSDGFESSFVSMEENLMRSGVKSHILVEWGHRGSAQVTEAEPIDYSGDVPIYPTDADINPLNLDRRMVKVFVDSPVERECIPNVYDETHYIASGSGKSY